MKVRETSFHDGAALSLLAGCVGVFGVDGQQRMEWKAISGFVYEVDWAHADRCVSASEDKTCQVWHPQTGGFCSVGQVRSACVDSVWLVCEDSDAGKRVLFLVQELCWPPSS
jgi:hypothetical protein